MRVYPDFIATAETEADIGSFDRTSGPKYPAAAAHVMAAIIVKMPLLIVDAPNCPR